MKNQISLLDELEVERTYDKDWIGMPEFVQEKQSPYAQIIFRFESKQDLDDFSKLISQRLTSKTKSAWYPFRSHFSGDKSIWTDES